MVWLTGVRPGALDEAGETVGVADASAGSPRFPF